MNSTIGFSAKELEGFPPGGFLQDYLEYAGRLTDAPAEYHLFTALTVLGAAASRVRIAYGAQRLAPVLWTVLVGAGPFYRKTTAIEIGRRVLAAARPAAAPPLIYSHERVLEALTNTDRLLAIEDFSDLLYSAPARRLAEFGDAGPRVSVLGAASPALLAAASSAWATSHLGELAGGLLARFAFVVPAKKTRWDATPREPDPAVESRLAEFLRRAAGVEGQVSFAECAAELREWGKQALAWVSTSNASEVRFHIAAGVLSRLEPTLLKLAALIEMAGHARIGPAGAAPGESSPGSPLRVSPASFRAARGLERHLRASFERLLGGTGAEPPFAARLLARVLREPGITRRRLQRNSRLDAATLRQLLGRLIRNGSIAAKGKRLYPGGSAAAETRTFARKGANGHRLEEAEVSA